MKQEILTRFPWPWLPTLGLLIFFIFFIALIFRVYTSSRREFFLVAESLPLDDGEKHEQDR